MFSVAQMAIHINARRFVKKRKLPRNTVVVEASDELLGAFEEMCRVNMWTKGEVLEHLLEYAVKAGVDLTYPIHRLRLRKHRGQKWHPPTF